MCTLACMLDCRIKPGLRFDLAVSPGIILKREVGFAQHPAPQPALSRW